MMNQCPSLSQKIWNISSDSLITDLPALQDLLLKGRGLTTHETIQRFLEPSLEQLENPWEMQGIPRAVDRIEQAIKNEERIIVFGDFDTDGITATVILVHTLQQLGAHVSYRIPERNTDSHGLKKHLLDELSPRKVGLVITVDCGINDAEEVAHAAQNGIDVIITDHHEPKGGSFPEEAIAVINPKVGSNGNTFPNLSGSAVAWKLAAALADRCTQDATQIHSLLDPLLEIAAIGIIADCVPLRGENRILAKFGIEKLKHTQWNGLLQLLEETGTSLEKITEETIGFVIAPHLNAASRIGDVLLAVQLFLGKEEEHASRIQHLREWNNSRRSLTEDSVLEAKTQVRPDAPFQILYNEDWKPGILGLLAARYSQQLGVPVIACSKRKDGKITASCRAPEPYSMINGLQNVESFLKHFGGHAGAAGFLMEKSQFEALTQALDTHFSETNIGALPLNVDAWISPELVRWELYDFLQFFAPFGMGNPTPILGIQNVVIREIRPMGAQKNHLKLSGNVAGTDFNFVAFFAGHFVDHLHIGDCVDIAFTLGKNEWNGEETLQLRVEDVRKR